MPQTFSDSDRQTVDTIVSKQLAATSTPGAIAGLWLPEQGAYVQTYGVGNRETGEPPSVDDHFRIASITKTFVATAILQLADAGDVDPDRPHRLGMLGEVHREGLLHLAVPDEVVEGGRGSQVDGSDAGGSGGI